MVTKNQEPRTSDIKVSETSKEEKKRKKIRKKMTRKD
jgi:hypothetical protein